MKAITVITLIALSQFGVLALVPEPVRESHENPDPSGPGTAIVNARVFDGEQVHENASLLIAAGRVRALGPELEIPAGARVVDAAGRTVLPGLIDAHVHSFGSARVDALRFGVTTVLDMFRPPFDFDQTRAERASFGPIDKADLFSAGFLATADGGHGTQYGIEVPTLAGPEEASDWVAARKAEGSDWIKIIIEPGWGGRELPTLDAAAVAALVEEAHAQGLMAVAHVSIYDDAMMAIEAGIDGLVHLFADQPVDAAFVDAARSAGVFVVPTLPVLAGLHGHGDPGWMETHPVLGPRITPAQRQGLAQRFPMSGGGESAWSKLVTSVRALHSAGIPILAGSDAPNPGTAHGVSVHHALRLLVEAGLSPSAALRAATTVPAAEFGLEGRGCLQPGCRADVLIVDGNPLADIEATANISAIWKNGQPVDFWQPETPGVASAVPSPERGPIAERVDLLATPARWMTAADDYMGGASTSRIAWLGEGAETTLKVTGRVAPGHPFPYAGAMWFASDIPMQPADHAGHRRLVVEIDGPQRQYQALLFSGDSQAVPPAQVPIELARENIIDLDSVAGLDSGQLRAVGVFASGSPGAVDFEIRVLRLE